MSNNKAKESKSSYVTFLSIILMLSALCLLSTEKIAYSDQGASYQGELLIENDSISADLKEVPLREVLEQVREQAHVWYVCDESLFREKISIQFKDLPLKLGMRRILASFDHALEFNAGGELIGLTLLGESGSDRNSTAARKRSIIGVSSRNRLGNESGTATRVVDLPRPLPVKVIDREGRVEASIGILEDPGETQYEQTEPEIKINIISPRNISSQSDHIISLPVPRGDTLESTTPDSGLPRGVPLDSLE